MAVLISAVDKGSPAHRCGVRPGETLLTIDGNTIRDVLDYRFYMTEKHLTMELQGEDGKVRKVSVTKGEYDELGLEFDTYLMDRQHHCKNKCVFCFIDQLPPGLRDTLYFKDDDSRMSFLFGSYVTLTNVSEEEIQRIIKMHISPINVSVHATNPEVRQKMMLNPQSGPSLRYLPMLVEAGIKVNTQLVICPGLNDGDELRRSLNDLGELAPGVQSIALVPVGLTKHRDGLYPLRPMTAEEAAECIDIAQEFGQRMLKVHGSRIAFASDELFVQAGRPIPDAEYYEDFAQLDNGVGIHALLRQEFESALKLEDGDDRQNEVTIACGVAAQPLLSQLTATALQKFPNLNIRVYGIPNRLFGDTVTVSGLVCGGDIIHEIKDKPLGHKVLIPEVMLRHEKDRFLDDSTVPQLEAALGVPVQVLPVDGFELLDALLGNTN
ncbi:MAG: DUF512 domain-containing protein [Angelakisella sp.]|nr:DUF512 domain-containing protein [Angelakisella sp.]